MRRIVVIVAIATVAYFAIRHRVELPAPPDPTALILSMRNQVPPFRLSLATYPEQPCSDESITLRVHAVDGAGLPVDGLKIEAYAAMSGSEHGARRLTLRSKGNGNYEGRVSLELAGSWDVDLSATKDGKSARERLNIDVGAPHGPHSADDDDDDS